MTTKEFFKSNAFKSILVLICIVLVAGFLLSICNDLLYVSDAERFDRSIQKLYDGREVKATPITLTDEQKTTDYGTVDEAYYVKDGESYNYLLKTTGNNGYSSGTVTLWTVLSLDENGEFAGIQKVVYESNKGQSYISNVKDSFYTYFPTMNETLIADEDAYFMADKGLVTNGLTNVATGASESSRAGCNAVNTALACYRSGALKGGQA